MSPARQPTQRILAVDPTSRGFGFVVMEGPTALVDWGVKEVRRNKRATTLRKVGKLIVLYRPDVVVLEDYAVGPSRRSRRLRELIEAVGNLATNLGVTLRRVSAADVRRAFVPEGARTKHQIASALARRFPDLGSRLPPPRKPWMPEDERMAIFDAARLAVALLEKRRARPYRSSSR